MWLYILLFIFVLLLLLICSLIIYARWNFGRLEKQGITVVQPNHFLLGGAMLSYQLNGGLLDIQHMKKYGSVFGLYEGREAQIFICDPELIRVITCKDAEYFNAKRTLEFGDPVLNEFLDFQPYNKWKTLKNMVSPVVSSLVRIKHADLGMQAAVREYIDGLKLQIMENGGKLNKYELDTGILEMLTDLIARSQFGINFDKSENFKRFVNSLKMLTRPPAAKFPQLAAYVYAFPFLRKILPNATVNPELFQEFLHFPQQMMEMRRDENKRKNSQSQESPRDLLDFMLEWYTDIKTNPNSKYAQNGVTEMSIYNLGLVLFLGSQHQISLILGTMMYHVAANPEIENKLKEEVDQAWTQNNGVFDHDIISKMSYLNACILEATRLHPFFFRAERVCTKDWEDTKRNIRIRKGDVVQVAIWAANRNPIYWPNPDEFQPERFLPGNKEKIHPYAFTSFGFGPRGCPGKRLSLQIMGMLAAYLVKELKFEKRKDTKLEFLPVGPFFGVHEPILFDLELR